jgi:hypothetical protein
VGGRGGVRHALSVAPLSEASVLASDPREAADFNQGANSVQANPNKTKQKSLDFLGFIRPNRDFSMGYERKNKKNPLASQVVCKTSQACGHPQFQGISASQRPYPANGNIIARIFWFWQTRFFRRLWKWGNSRWIRVSRPRSVTRILRRFSAPAFSPPVNIQASGLWAS